MTVFTRTSPTGGLIPLGATEVGGIVLDLIGLNGVRVTSQLAASSLYNGYFDSGTPSAYQGNPGTIGIQSGISASVLAALGGGLASVSVRVSLFDGDTAPGDFDNSLNLLLLNGVTLGNFSSVTTQETGPDGLIVLSSTSGFADETLSTGWFTTNDAAFLTSFFTSLQTTGQVTYTLNDAQTPYDNYFDFTRGVDGGLINVGQAPNVFPVANDDFATTTSGAAVTINVALNDIDPDGMIVAYALATGPAHGSYTLNGNNTITYVPNSGYVGTDSFTYSVTDDRGATSFGLVDVDIKASSSSTARFVRLTEGNDTANYGAEKSGIMVQALNGDDSVTGSAFNDSINGGFGADTLRGGGGNDIITGGAGIDRVQGGTGNDTFIFASGDLVNPANVSGGIDHIIDFHGAGGYSTGENDFIRFTGLGAGSLIFDHNLGGDATKQMYNVYDGSGNYSGSLLVQMADGVNKLAVGDFFFA